MGVSDIVGLIVIILILVGVPASIIIGLKSEEKKLNKLYSLFKKGMTLEYYTQKNHGKFRKDVLIASYEILDSDGRFIWMKNKKTGVECETDLYLDCKYSDMVLKDTEGKIVRKFQFEL